MVQRAKENFRKKLDEEFLHTTETLWENEVNANIFVAKSLIVTAVIISVAIILNYVGIFTVKQDVMLKAGILGIIEVLIPALICFKLKGRKKWLKTLMLAEYTIVLARMGSILTHNVALALVLPVVLSVRYYSKYITISAACMTTLLAGVSAWAGVKLQMGILNLNVLPIPDGTVLTVVDGLRNTIMSTLDIDYDAACKATLIGDFLPRFLCYSVTATICVEIAEKGRKAIFDQENEAKKTERISTELNLASETQTNMLPNIFPAFPERTDFDIFATMSPAKEVGGDFYDFFFVNDTHLALVMADVSGKGIPAAMFMVIAKTLIKDHAQLGLNPGEVFTRVNKILCEGNESGLFVTAWMGILDLNSGLMTYVNAGHNPPVVCLNGEVEFLKCKAGFVLAGMETTKYSEATLQFHKNDKIFLYTDGATEATNINNELYGDNRLLECLKKQTGKSVEDALHSVRSDIDAFVGEAEQFDDLTLLAFDYAPKDSDPPMQRIELEVDATIENFRPVLEFIEKNLEEHDASMKAINVIDVAAEEMYVNVAHYAYTDLGITGKCKIAMWFDGDDVYIELTDSGIPFDPLAKVDPDIHLKAEDRNIGGLGIYMVKKSMDECKYQRTEDGKNIFTMRRSIR